MTKCLVVHCAATPLHASTLLPVWFFALERRQGIEGEDKVLKAETWY